MIPAILPAYPWELVDTPDPAPTSKSGFVASLLHGLDAVTNDNLPKSTDV